MRLIDGFRQICQRDRECGGYGPVGLLVRKLSLVGVAVLCLCLLGAFSAHAQNSHDRNGYLPSFPTDGTYRTLVIGDSFARGIVSGLGNSVNPIKDISLFENTKIGYGLISPRKHNWANTLQDELSNKKYEIAIVMMGAYDRKSILMSTKKWAKVGSTQWIKAYRKRVSKLLSVLKKNQVAVYWVGLPIMRGPKTNSYAQFANQALRTQLTIDRVQMIDIWSRFANRSGKYADSGPAADGKYKQLRAADGIHFTSDGNEKLVYYIEQALRRDMSFAKSQRTVELAGSRNDLRLIYRRRKDFGTGLPTYMQKKNDKEPNTQMKTASIAVPEPQKDISQVPQVELPHKETPQEEAAPAGGHTVITYRPRAKEAGQGQQSASVQVKIFRPKIKTRDSLDSRLKRGDPNQSLLKGDSLVHDEDGLLSYSMISLTNSLLLMAGQDRKPLSQTPYFKVLVEGKATGGRTGRVDDFALPTVPRP